MEIPESMRRLNAVIGIVLAIIAAGAANVRHPLKLSQLGYPRIQTNTEIVRRCIR